MHQSRLRRIRRRSPLSRRRAATACHNGQRRLQCRRRDCLDPQVPVKPGDVVLVQGTCGAERRDSVGEFSASLWTVKRRRRLAPGRRAADAVQVLGREITIKGFRVTGGSFGIAINRGATAILDRDTVRNAANSGFEVSHNSFARIINNTVERNQQHGIVVLGSASVHSVNRPRTTRRPRISSGTMPWMGFKCCARQRLASSAIRSVGTDATGLTVQKASHADVAGNLIHGNARAAGHPRGWKFWSEPG